MRLSTIIFYSMGLGILVGLIVSRLGQAVGDEWPAAQIGMLTAVVATVIAGRIQPRSH